MGRLVLGKVFIAKVRNLDQHIGRLEMDELVYTSELAEILMKVRASLTADVVLS